MWRGGKTGRRGREAGWWCVGRGRRGRVVSPLIASPLLPLPVHLVPPHPVAPVSLLAKRQAGGDVEAVRHRKHRSVTVLPSTATTVAAPTS